MIPVPQQRTLAPGDIVAGRYRIEGQIGQGGFGAVFTAMQLNLGRRVALKVILPDLIAQHEGMSRFRREAELAQRLEHPNTVRLLDFGQDEQGTPFIAFELLNGQPLDRLIQTTKGLPPQRVARIASQVLKSLMEAHARGIVHRDVKPSNIFLCDFSGEPDFVKVLDFGIAKPIAPAGQTTAGLTRQGTAIGTPNYMAPEQVAGSKVGPPCDLYALGLVMAEALMGEPVFKGNSVLQICVEQLSPAPVPHAPQVLQSPLGPVIHRATQKPVERRYGSAGEMLEHLEAVVRQHGDAARSSQGSVPASYPAAPVGYAPTGMVAPGMGPTPPSPAAFGAPSYGPAPGYAPVMGQGYAAAPPMMYPPVPAQVPVQARPKSSAGTTALLIGGAVLLLGLFACAGLFAILGDSGSTTTTNTAGKKSQGSSGSSRANLRELTAPKIRERVESLGFKVLGESNSNSQGVSVNSVTVTRTSQSGAVMLYRFDETFVAQSTEESLRNNANAAVARDGNMVLFVMVSPSGSKELLDSIAR